MRNMTSKSYADIFDQASTLPGTIELLTRTAVPPVATRPGQSFVFTGCGSSYYVAQCGAQLLRALSGVSASAAPGSEVWLLPDLWLDENSVLVAISRTGTTTEVLRALERARERGIPAITISLAADVPMHELSDVSLTLTHVQEAGRVMLQSFANMLVAVQWLVATIAHAAGSAQATTYLQGLHGVAGAVSDLLPTFDREAQAIVEQGVGQFVFLGSGPFTGVCAESVLKVQEMAQAPAESYAGLEYRHGPIATLTDRSFVACVSCARTIAFDTLLAGDVQFLGGTPLIVGPEDCLRAAPAGVRTISLPAGLPDWLYGNVALPFFQLLAYHQTIKQGANPDSVRLLDRMIDPHINPHDVDLALASPLPV
jgi:glucosamine--fructose-6-phosphate aminotransferase (isomerizing)